MTQTKLLRKIPATMATQHPDHANKPDWYHQAFIEVNAEYKEAYLSFAKLGIDEYNWDWEGKLVDESVIEKFFTQYFAFFKKNPLGKKYFLTFRIPNPNWEVEFRLGRAFMGLLSASGLASEINFHNPPLFEVILPMTENEQQILAVQEAFQEIATLEHRLFHLKAETLKYLEVIPLFEEVRIIMDSANIIKRYLVLHKQKFGFKPGYIRPYFARSDAALNAGIVPNIVAVKIALSNFAKLSKQTGIKIFPMVGCGTLPFRGGNNPMHIDTFINEYHGISTTTIQSAFRYDFPLDKVKSAVQKLKKELPEYKAREITNSEEKQLTQIIFQFEKIYKKQIEGIADQINQVALALPKRRERMQHVGLFGYSRGVGKVKLPRAISFTAALYSLGVPPELISTGRGLASLTPKEMALLEKVYLNIRTDLSFAGGFFNRENLENLIKKNRNWAPILDDIKAVEKYLGLELGPKTATEKKHVAISSQILLAIQKNKKPTAKIIAAAKLRHSLG